MIPPPPPQYYATVDAGGPAPAGTTSQCIRWLTKENIKDWPASAGGGVAMRRNDAGLAAGLADMVGAGQSVGGVVSDPIGPNSPVRRLVL